MASIITLDLIESAYDAYKEELGQNRAHILSYPIKAPLRMLSASFGLEVLPDSDSLLQQLDTAFEKIDKTAAAVVYDNLVRIGLYLPKSPLELYNEPLESAEKLFNKIKDEFYAAWEKRDISEDAEALIEDIDIGWFIVDRAMATWGSAEAQSKDHKACVEGLALEAISVGYHAKKIHEELIMRKFSGDTLEGPLRKLFRSLKPFDLGPDTSIHTRGFVGRKWLFTEFDEWLQKERSKVFLITGDPGAGKSAIMSELAYKELRVSAHHFCKASVDASVDPFIFVKSIATQLSTQMDNYRASLGNMKIDHLDTMDAGKMFHDLLAKPLKVSPPDRQILIVIDALDEAYVPGERVDIPRLLSVRLQDLPSWVRFAISSRQEPEIIRIFGNFQLHGIEVGRAENLKDIETFLDLNLKSPKLSALMAKKGLSRNRIMARLTNLANGNFLHATQMLAGIEEGRIEPSREDILPDRLVAQYTRFFEQTFPDHATFQQVRQVLDMICAGIEPFSAEELGRYLSRDSFEIEQLMKQVAVFFPLRDGRYKAYHQSIKDWLLGDDNQRELYQVKVKTGHELICDFHWNQYKQGVSALTPYGLKNLAMHLCETERWDNLERLLTDLRFVDAKVEAGETYDLISDYSRTLRSLPEAQKEIQQRRHNENMVDNYIQDLITYAQGEIDTLDIIQSARPWTEERIKQDSEEIRNNLTRFDRICAFSQFVNAEAHVLAKPQHCERFCWQHAYNSTGSGPVFEAAEKLLDKEKHAPLLLNLFLCDSSYNPFPAMLRTIDLQDDFFESICVSPDGESAITVSVGKFDDKLSLRLWDLTKGFCIRSLTKMFHRPGHETRISMTPDKCWAIFHEWESHEYARLRLWNLETGECSDLDPKFHAIASHATYNYERDGILAVLEQYTEHKLSYLSGLDLLETLPKGAFQEIKSAAGYSVTPDGLRAVTGTADNMVRLWDLTDGTCLKVLEGHTAPVRAVSITPDGLMAVSGGLDGDLRLWDLRNGQCVRAYDHYGWVNAVVVTADGRKAVTGGVSTVHVWDLERGLGKRPIKGMMHYSTANIETISADGRRCLLGNRDAPSAERDKQQNRIIKVMDMDSSKTLKYLEGSHAIEQVQVSPDDRWAFVGYSGGGIGIWDIEHGLCVRKVPGGAWGKPFHLTPDGLAVVSGNGTNVHVESYAFDQYYRVLSTNHLSYYIQSVVVSPDGRSVVTAASSDKLVRVMDIRSGKFLASMKVPVSMFPRLSMTADGLHVVFYESFSGLHLMKLATGIPLASLYPRGRLRRVQANRSSNYISCANYDGTLKVIKIVNAADAPMMTGVRLWRYGKNGKPGHWDDHISTQCGWCSKRIALSGEVLSVIDQITRNASLEPFQSPCLYLPLEAWDEPRLLSDCPACGKTLKFNPFVVDNRDLY